MLDDSLDECHLGRAATEVRHHLLFDKCILLGLKFLLSGGSTHDLLDHLQSLSLVDPLVEPALLPLIHFTLARMSFGIVASKSLELFELLVAYLAS